MEQQQQAQCTGGQIVVLAADSSDHSEVAFNYYVKEVHRPDYVLHVVHIAEGYPSVHPMDGGPSPGHAKELQKKHEESVKTLREKYVKWMAESQVTGEFVVVGGSHKNAWHDIISYQEKVGGVMIVIGSRGLGAIKRTMVGSVSDSVVHHAHCPVLVCRHG